MKKYLALCTVAAFLCSGCTTIENSPGAKIETASASLPAYAGTTVPVVAGTVTSQPVLVAAPLYTSSWWLYGGPRQTGLGVVVGPRGGVAVRSSSVGVVVGPSGGVRVGAGGVRVGVGPRGGVRVGVR